MIDINGVTVEFDILSPSDMLRYKSATEKLRAESENIKALGEVTEGASPLDAYIDILNQGLRMFGNYIDEVFGDGVANQLLGKNPSMSKVGEIQDAINSALERSGDDFVRGITAKIGKYTPNRATRRKG